MAIVQEQDTRAEVLSRHTPVATQFRVAEFGEGKCFLTSYNRRDFYKVTLVLSGFNRLLFANRSIELNGPALVFTNPQIPYKWETDCIDHVGWFCIFTEDFLNDGKRSDSLQRSALFRPGGEPVYLLNDEQRTYAESVFRRMRAEMDSDYVYKNELIRTQLNLLIHEAIKMQPPATFSTAANASARIAGLFTDLLERQFPIESPTYALQLRKPADYATLLSVHINHLNAAVQETTGKTTTAHIADRMVSEARQLLLHTDWSVADIAYSLGFEYTSYFNTFFRKHTGTTPGGLRKSL